MYLPIGESPGPDGFNAEFYQFFWPDLGDHLFAAINSFFLNSSLASSWGQTFIALIPKKENPLFWSLILNLYLFVTCALKFYPRLWLTDLS